MVKNNTIPWCLGNSLKVMEPPGPITGLLSYPGSGNTWLRYLIQKTTGYVTGVDHQLTTIGDIKRKFILRKNLMFYNGFPGEILLLDGTAVLYKSHLRYGFIM